MFGRQENLSNAFHEKEFNNNFFDESAEILLK